MKKKVLYVLCIVSLMLCLVGCKVNSVEKAIKAIGTVTESSLSSIENAKNLYNELKPKKQAKVENYSDLVNAEKKYNEIVEDKANQKAADEVVALINAIGKVDENSLPAIEKAQKAYDALSSGAKSKVSNFSVIAQSKAQYEAVLEDIAIQKAADEVVALINAIGKIDENSLPAIEKAQKAYDALSSGAKSKVSNFSVIAQSKAQYEAVLEDIAIQKAADSVIDAIKAIGKVSDKSLSAIDKAQKLYDALSAEAKARVSNYSVLVTSKSKYESILADLDLQTRINAVIEAIDIIGKVNKNSLSSIEYAQKLYDLIPASAKSRVSNYKTLTAAVERYELLTRDPIKAEYELYGYKLEIEAGVGKATVKYPSIVTAKDVTDAIVALNSKYREAIKDITYTLEEGVLTLYYPEEWGEKEFANAESILSTELVAYVDAILTEQANQKAADEVIAAIKAIGEVTVNSLPAIEKAQKLYDLVPASAKSRVSNYKTLTAAVERYELLTRDPIKAEYELYGYKLDIEAGVGKATVKYPSIITTKDVTDAIVALNSKYREVLKDITYSIDKNVLTLYYPEEWGEKEFAYAEDIISKELVAYVDAILTEQANKKAAAEVVAAIKAIGTVTEDSMPTIEKAQKMYDALSADAKKKVTNYSAIAQAKAKYEAVIVELALQKGADGVMAVINAIGNVTENSLPAIEKAQKMYDALSADAKKRVTNYSAIARAKSQYEAIVADKAAQKAADEVIAAINAIGTVTANSREAIDKAQKLFDSLPADVSIRVKNYAVLASAKAEYNEILNNQAMQKKIAEAIDAINAIGKVSKDSFKAINKADKIYQALPEELKSQVDNYSVFLVSVKKYDRMQVKQPLQKFSVYYSPYSFQSITTSDEDEKDLQSLYATAVKVGYSIQPFKKVNIFAGADFTYQFSDINGVVEHYKDWLMLGKLGYRCELGEVLTLSPAMYLGLDLQNFKNKTNAVLTFGPTLDVGFNLSNHWSLNVQVDGLFSFSKKNDVKYGNYKLNTFIGANFTL